MKLTLSIDAARVYDDVLDARALDDMWRFMNLVPYAWSNAGQYIAVWSWTEGAMLYGPTWTAKAPEWHLLPQQLPGDSQSLPENPRPFLALMEKVRSICADMTGIPEINGLLMRPYVWPPGANISWHADGLGRVGAFSFYVHKAWHAEWGGEFMLTGTTFEGKRGQVENEAACDAVLAAGHGTWVSPVCNRLVINPSNMLHKTNKTTDAAAARMTIQGFLFA